MPPPASEQPGKTIETLYRTEFGRILAALVRLLGDLDLAEKAMIEEQNWAQVSAFRGQRSRTAELVLDFYG